MTDLISRQAAIEALKRNIWDPQVAKDGIDAISNLPSAQKHGKWEEHNGWKQCTYCAAAVRIETIFGMKRDNFCPNCGARMEERIEQYCL